MLFFVSADFFRRRRLQRPTDDVPVAPLLNLLAFWSLLGLGTFSAAVAVFTCVAIASLGVPGTRTLSLVIVALSFASVVAINAAFVFWWRLRE